MGDALKEHHHYISDATRLALFESAVSRVLRPGDAVVDVGCGFGVLGLLCLKAGAGHVWGIDETEAIEVAREAMARAGFADRYTCMRQSSYAATLPAPADVAICDHVGYFGIDYGILPLLDDVRRRLLKPGGKVLPQRILLQVAAASSRDCRALAEAWHKGPQEYRWLDAYSANTKHMHEFAADELASPPTQVGDIDLRDPAAEVLALSGHLQADRAGELDGLAGWFECEIADGVWMTNSPLAERPIKRGQVFLPFARRLAVERGDVVEVRISVRSEPMLISWRARVARTGQEAHGSTWSSTILAPADLQAQAAQVPRLNELGRARRHLLERADGTVSAGDLEQTLLAEFPALFPTPRAARDFVRREMHRSAT